MADGINFNLLTQDIPNIGTVWEAAKQRDIQTQMAQNQLRAAQMQFEQAQNAAEENARLKRLYSQPGFDINNPEHRREIMNISPTQGMALEAEARKIDAEKAKAEKERTETAGLKAKHEREKLHGAIQHIVSFDTRQGILDDLYQQEASGGISPEAAAQLRNSLPTTDEELPKWQMRVLRGMMSAEKQVELSQPKVVGNKLVSPAGEILASHEPESDLARYQRERAEIFKNDPNDPRLAQFDDRIKKLTTSEKRQSELLLKQNELADLEAQLVSDPNNAQLKQRIKQYRDDLRKDTTWKPDEPKPGVSPTEQALVSKAILEGRLDPGKVNSRNLPIIASTLAMDPNANLRELNIDALSGAAASKALATQSAKILTAATEADKMIDIVRKTSTRVDRTQYPTVNAIQNAVNKGTGGKAIVELNTALNALINAYARAINPTGVATVSDKKHAREIVNSNYASGQLDAILGVMQEEMRIAKASPGEASAALKAARNKPAAGAGAPPPPPGFKAD